MQLLHTVVKVKETFDRKAFVELVLKWNDTSKHERIKDLTWDGMDYQFEVKDENQSLCVFDYEEEQVIASCYKKMDQNGILWTIELVLNYETHIVSLQLDRVATNETKKFNWHYKHPYLLTMLVDEDIVDDDAGLKAIGKPIRIDRKNQNVIEEIIKDERSPLLPVVYCSKDEFYEYSVDVYKLAKSLQGIAHVLIEEDPMIQNYLRVKFNKESPYGGFIGVYYPNRTYSKMYNPNKFFDSDDLIQTIESNIVNYMNRQMIDPLSTYVGIKLAYNEGKFKESLKEKEEIEQEVDDLYNEYGTIELDYKNEIEELKNRILSLELENQGLRAKMEKQDQHPVLHRGSEDPLFEGELEGIVLDVLNQALNSTYDGSRRECVIKDLLEANGFDHSVEQKVERIKNALKGYSSRDAKLERELADLGFKLRIDGRHYKVVYYDDERYVTTMTKTASDHRDGKNIAANLIKTCL